MHQTPDFYTFTIIYTNGEKQVYRIPRQGDINTLAKRLDDLRQYDEMAIQTVENKLILIPYQNIQRVEIEPFPEVYAKNMLHGATLISN